MCKLKDLKIKLNYLILLLLFIFTSCKTKSYSVESKMRKCIKKNIKKNANLLFLEYKPKDYFVFNKNIINYLEIQNLISKKSKADYIKLFKFLFHNKSNSSMKVKKHIYSRFKNNGYDIIPIRFILFDFCSDVYLNKSDTLKHLHRIYDEIEKNNFNDLDNFEYFINAIPEKKINNDLYQAYIVLILANLSGKELNWE